MKELKRKGLLFVVSAPSGAGKTSLCKRVVELDPNLRHSVSYTTRSPRANEEEGVHYHFISQDTFSRMIEEEKFVEWAEVHGNRYGTAGETLKKYEYEGMDVILDIDVQGADQLRNRLNGGVYIFVLPPSPEELRNRLVGRGTDHQETINKRLENARGELSHIGNYDYIVINDRFDDAVVTLRSIIDAERRKKEIVLPSVRGMWKI